MQIYKKKISVHNTSYLLKSYYILYTGHYIEHVHKYFQFCFPLYTTRFRIVKKKLFINKTNFYFILYFYVSSIDQTKLHSRKIAIET